ncbi:organic cation/carnitine transporter 7-like isoform X4 [Phragmites australis]|uniref:organic cation/carnitine transporter 7-like isoform X4 n=1 Tax=Phragmites australis TaxID=29695 RepID=UPI002D77AB90|nr:organic cation/carnitine transporter 7-like isoform X4 [Phragmites australis]
MWRMLFEMEEGQSATYTVDDALLSSGFGKFQISILSYAGIGLIAEAMEMMLLSFVGPSVQLEWKLTSHQESMITSVVFVGMLIGAYSWGVVSDNYGRRQTVMPKFGWRWLLALSAVPSFVLLLFYAIIPESPRFLCMKGRTTEAMEVLEKMARLNNIQLPSGRLVSDKNIELDEVSRSSESAILLASAEENGNINEDEGSNFGGIKSVGKLLAPKLIRATLLLWMAFFGNAFSYYGIVLLTSELSNGNRICAKEEVESIHSNNASLYKNVFISSFAEIPGSVLSAMIVDRFGRKLSMASMLFTSCVFLFPLVFSRAEILTRISLFGARLCISASFTIIYIYAPEIYPTSVRTTGIGIASSVGRIGGILCPLVAVALVHNCQQTTAILLFELVIFLSGLAVAFFPFETKGCRLNDTEVDMH